MQSIKEKYGDATAKALEILKDGIAKGLARFEGQPNDEEFRADAIKHLELTFPKSYPSEINIFVFQSVKFVSNPCGGKVKVIGHWQGDIPQNGAPIEKSMNFSNKQLRYASRRLFAKHKKEILAKATTYIIANITFNLPPVPERINIELSNLSR